MESTIDMEGGETITLNLEDAAQIILQEQDGAVTIAPGTYHILTQENGQIQLTAEDISGEEGVHTIGIAVKESDILSEGAHTIGIAVNESDISSEGAHTIGIALNESDISGEVGAGTIGIAVKESGISEEGEGAGTIGIAVKDSDISEEGAGTIGIAVNESDISEELEAHTNGIAVKESDISEEGAGTIGTCIAGKETDISEEGAGTIGIAMKQSDISEEGAGTIGIAVKESGISEEGAGTIGIVMKDTDISEEGAGTIGIAMKQSDISEEGAGTIGIAVKESGISEEGAGTIGIVMKDTDISEEGAGTIGIAMKDTDISEEGAGTIGIAGKETDISEEGAGTIGIAMKESDISEEVAGTIGVAGKDTDISEEGAHTVVKDVKEKNEPVLKSGTGDKQLDLSKPIAVTNRTEVVINGKKCILMANPATGELCAYPVLPPPGKRRRGRPRKEEGQPSPASTRTLEPPNSQQDKEQTASAAEGLLELRNTGPDGLRRSGRARKKAKLFDDYEVLEVSSDSGEEDENGSKRRRLEDQKEYIPMTPYIVPGSGVKRGRGRPRRYPPPGQTSTNTQIPAVIIPGANGQSLMMAPIQGLSNLQAFQEQVKALPTLISKDGQSVSLIGESDPDIAIDTSQHSSEEAELTEAASSAEAIAAGTVSIPTTDMTDSKEVESEGDSQTIIQIPENLLPMFLPKKDPIKLGLKASESELGKLKCSKCDFQAYYAQQYQAHIASHTEDIHKCKCCNFLAFDRDDLLSHFKENHPRCICTECEFMAEHAYIIKRHMMRHSSSGCTCEMCGRVYKDQYILKMHIKMVHMPVEVLFECNVCSKKFTRKAHLKRHLRIHEPEKPFKCPHCDYRGCERSDISKHLLIHEEPRHVCEVCGKAFRHIKNKELHLKRHNGQRDYKCGVCDFYGYTFTDIRKHIERKHADIKTLVCDKCGSAFKSEALLREHQKQQCDMLMIEQALAIANSTGGTSQATIQIPSSFNLDGQQITIDGQQIALDSSGQVNITVEQVTLPEEENIALTEVTEEQLQESLRNNTISVTEGHIIDTDELGELNTASHISEAQIIECDDVDALNGGIISVSEAQVTETDVSSLRDDGIVVSESEVIETHQVQALEGMVLEGDEEEDVEEGEAMIQVVTDEVDISVGEELSVAMPE